MWLFYTGIVTSYYKKASGNTEALYFTSACSNDEHGSAFDSILARHNILLRNSADDHNKQDGHNRRLCHNKQVFRNIRLCKLPYDKDGQNVRLYLCFELLQIEMKTSSQTLLSKIG